MVLLKGAILKDGKKNKTVITHGFIFYCSLPQNLQNFELSSITFPHSLQNFVLSVSVNPSLTACATVFTASLEAFAVVSAVSFIISSLFVIILCCALTAAVPHICYCFLHTFTTKSLNYRCHNNKEKYCNKSNISY